jgi:purine nucleoside permease
MNIGRKSKNVNPGASLTRWALFAKSLVALFIIITFLIFLLSRYTAENIQGEFKIRVLVLTTFDGEAKPWLDHEKWPLIFNVNGAHGLVLCQKNGVCLTTTGMGKSNSGPSLTAILHASQLNTNNTYFIVAGIAGTRPDSGNEGYKGTLGFTGIANWIIDGDLGTHFDYRDVKSNDPANVRQYAWIKLQDYENSSFHLNEDLAAKAYNLTKNIQLADDATAQTTRNMYPSQKGLHPFVARCDTVGADNFFSGTNEVNTMDHLVRIRSNGAATKCTSEFEDPGFANALRLNGKLDRLIVVRSASDFETPAPRQTTVELLSSGLPGYSIAIENEYRVGSKIAHSLSTN